MIKNVHLGFFINEYNKKPIWTDLITFPDVNELDRFMDYFYNNNEKIRKQFDHEIGEYSIDNMGQFIEIDKIIKGNFRGRISAYYYNDNNQMEFIELPTPKRKPIRDYRIIPDLKTACKCLTDIFDDAVAKVNKKYGNIGPNKGQFIHYICEKLHQASYDVSDEELYYLTKYYNHQNDKTRKDCITLIRTNVRRFFLAKAQKEYEESKNREDHRNK